MRKIWDIHGGIHPPENKQQSLGSAISAAPLPPRLVLPLSQHIGAPATAIVAVGERVLKGQLIAEANGPVSVAIHAPSSGTVSAIESRPIAHPSGMQDRCIVIDTDGQEQWIDCQGLADWQSASQADLLAAVRAGGIAGMGGAGFPASVKLSGRPGQTIDTLILNGTECEPYITADHALLKERQAQLAEGIAILTRLIDPEHIILGIEDNKSDTVAGMEQALAAFDFASIGSRAATIEVATFPTKYPSGGEKQLIQILTGKQVPSGGLPADLGIVCHNLGTAVAIRDAVVDGRPLISRITTLTGEAIAKPGNVETLLGTPTGFLLEQFGYDASANNRLIMGGPMMGFAINSLDVPIVKTSNCLLAPTERELPTPPPAQACIRCGLCAEACPASLLPQQLYWFSQGKELDKLTAHNIADCIECGACSYVCPSHIPLVQYYRASKAEIRQRDQDMRAAEASKQRFDARQARLERLEAEKIAARKARQAKAKARSQSSAAKPAAEASAGDDKQAAIAAAVARNAARKQQTPPAATDRDASDQAAAAKTSDKATVTGSAAASDDPIAKALAKRAAAATNNADPAAAAAEALAKAKQRLDKAKTRLADAEARDDENIDAFRAAVDKAQSKYDAAAAAAPAASHEPATALAADKASDKAASQTESSNAKASDDASKDDPIAKALAKRAAAAAAGPVDPLEAAKQAVEKALQRRDKARQRFEQAEQNSDDKLSAFAAGLEKAEAKLAEAEAALSALEAQA